MSDNPRTSDAPRQTESAETVEPGVAHVEIEPGETTETAGRGPLQIDDETGQRAPRDASAAAGDAGRA